MIIRDKQCATCIYRPDSPLDLDRLEDAVRDPYNWDHFTNFRACHSFHPRTDVVCAGFAQRHGDNCGPIRVMRRLQRCSAWEERR